MLTLSLTMALALTTEPTLALSREIQQTVAGQAREPEPTQPLSLSLALDPDPCSQRGSHPQP